MKKIDIGQTITIFANIGVIAGIVFLAIELNQNNMLLRNEARYNIQLGRAGEVDDLWSNSELIEFLAEVRSRGLDGIESTERDRFHAFVISRVIRWEWYFEQYENGLIERETLPTAAWVYFLGNNPAALGPLEEASTFVSPRFAQFLEENVLTQLGE